jgi:hypothetical protein
MNRYRVVLHGTNFLLKREGRKQRLGFRTTRWVEANDVADAATQAFAAIQEDERLWSELLNEREDPPFLEVEDLDPASRLEGPSGYAFYRMESAPVSKRRRWR